MPNLAQDLTGEDIEGVIFKTDRGAWVAFFDNNGQSMRCKVDYCPWCGKGLRSSDKGHTH